MYIWKTHLHCFTIMLIGMIVFNTEKSCKISDKQVKTSDLNIKDNSVSAVISVSHIKIAVFTQDSQHAILRLPHPPLQDVKS